jgi:hypothetical protein
MKHTTAAAAKERGRRASIPVESIAACWPTGVIRRPVSTAWIEIARTSSPSTVVLGEADDGPLRGAVTLESLGLMGNPLSRELVPMWLTLAPLPV